MNVVSATSAELVTRNRPINIADGLAGVVFRDIIAICDNDQVIKESPNLPMNGLRHEDLFREKMPFDDENRAARLLGILGATVFRGSVATCPSGLANFFVDERVNPHKPPTFSSLSPARVNGLSEGVLYVPVIGKNNYGTAVIGTNNPAQVLHISKKNISLVKSGDVLHRYNAIFLAEAK